MFEGVFSDQGLMFLYNGICYFELCDNPVFDYFWLENDHLIWFNLIINTEGIDRSLSSVFSDFKIYLEIIF